MRLRWAPVAFLPAPSQSSWSYSAICSRRNCSWYSPRHADALEAAVGDDDAVPLAAGDLGGQDLAAFPRQVFLGGDEQLGVGIELHELAGELLQQMVGHDIHRLLDQPGLFHLHAGGGHRVGLAGPDGVGQQRVAAAHAAPDGVFLMRPERDRLVHAGEVEVRAVEQPGPQIVVGVVVEPHQPLGAVGVGEHPGAEALLDRASASPWPPASPPG